MPAEAEQIRSAFSQVVGALAQILSQMLAAFAQLLLEVVATLAEFIQQEAAPAADGPAHLAPILRREQNGQPGPDGDSGCEKGDIPAVNPITVIL
jgi:hypothetical protein